ncbi:hypothetical protein HGRIS_012822 [Hohenbuehelia grisea]|uniref:Uncharacterized protein n=1 Tax=Hohenbuehelia grisea TaxID=104357 RepID=A0ABR3ITI0_9AGAR
MRTVTVIGKEDDDRDTKKTIVYELRSLALSVGFEDIRVVREFTHLPALPVISSVEEFSLSLDLPWNRPNDFFAGIETASRDVDVIHNMGWWMGSSISYRGFEVLYDLRPQSHLTFADILTNYPHYPTYTSNELSWIIQDVEGYHGETILRDTPHANIELLPVWEHALHLAKIVRGLGAACPSLAEFNWYVQAEEIDDDAEDDVGYVYRDPMWKWNILRNNDASVRFVNGHLYWKGGLRGDPPPLRTLVGREASAAVARNDPV